jgi:dihydrofolate synthase/folylpolyglutamate synthase
LTASRQDRPRDGGGADSAGRPDARRPTSLAAWLAYLETLHPKTIALGLDRVRAVGARLDLALACPVVTVTGTNGKGSTCALLESTLRAAGYRVALYTSPHLLRYNERVRVDARDVTDEALVDAFDRVEDARLAAGGVPLTYFEFGTLAALWLFAATKPDAVILEVGLGGRLDAVNIVDADVAVVTSIDLDHMDYLGPTREDIAREKAGIFRAGRPAVCAEPSPPQTLVEHATAIGAPLLQIGRDYGYLAEAGQWQYWGPSGRRYGLPWPALRGAHQLANASTALAALDLLRDRLPVSGGAVRDGLLLASLPGRFQVLPGRPTIVLDVAHNPHAAHVLAAAAGAMGFHRETRAVLGMLADKDIPGVIAAIRPRVDRWYVATLPGPRGASAAALATELARAGVDPAAVRPYDDVAAAFAAAREDADEADRILVFGSFLTVAGALAAAASGAHRAPRHG